MPNTRWRLRLFRDVGGTYPQQVVSKQHTCSSAVSGEEPDGWKRAVCSRLNVQRMLLDHTGSLRPSYWARPGCSAFPDAAK